VALSLVNHYASNEQYEPTKITTQECIQEKHLSDEHECMSCKCHEQKILISTLHIVSEHKCKNMICNWYHVAPSMVNTMSIPSNVPNYSSTSINHLSSVSYTPTAFIPRIRWVVYSLYAKSTLTQVIQSIPRINITPVQPSQKVRFAELPICRGRKGFPIVDERLKRNNSRTLNFLRPTLRCPNTNLQSWIDISSIVPCRVDASSIDCSHTR